MYETMLQMRDGVERGSRKKNANVVAFTASSSDWHRALRMIRIKKMLANMVEGTKAASVPVSNVQ
ncbi:hypothetical protein PRIPAC_77860 [Pristionchus pacificus]|uniref:Uncharacterized protein n=1 Tax=Pristionchus pacificus TaxID=54126 RepID=A0A2A6CK81_PRIPA|nr:hypothetical protein PRIPAC_77860 [Pristionchus pacificus]|eukprot:PDM78602.1 hypothetical protein PRIPAC_31181 [Pristionchus pacificus]